MEEAPRPTTLGVTEDFDAEDPLIQEYQQRQDRLTKIALSDAFEELDKIFRENIESLERGEPIDGIQNASNEAVGQVYKACRLAADYIKNIQAEIKEAGEVHANTGKRD